MHIRRDINDLEEVRSQGTDARCLENLVTAHNDTFIDSSMWLAPLANQDEGGLQGRLYKPVTLTVSYYASHLSFTKSLLFTK